MPQMGKTVGAKIPKLQEIISPDRVIQYGSRGVGVKLTQEWLTIHDFATPPDGKFGPATGQALFDFCRKEGLDSRSSAIAVNDAVWSTLWAPMSDALAPVLSDDAVRKHHSNLTGKSEGAAKGILQTLVPKTALDFAKQHHAANAHEIGRNQGPWVRLYMDADPVKGHDGPEYAWCGAFVRFCIQQALENLDVAAAPNTVWGMQEGWSVDRVAEWAILHSMFFEKASPKCVRPGSLFLIHRVGRDWTHIGFVEEYDPNKGVVKTIEGNTNIAGHRDGIAVMRRYRAVTSLNFVDGYYGVPA